MAVSAERLAIDPCLRDGIDGLVTIQSQQLGNDCSSSNLDENDVVKADAVERVFEGEAALDFVCLDHGFQDVLDLGCWEALGLVGTGKPICYSEDTAKVVGGMAPFCGEPAVVVVEPSDSSADVEGTPNGVELVRGSGDFGAVGNDGACTCGVGLAPYKKVGNRESRAFNHGS